MTRKLNFTAIFEKILQNKQSNFTKSKFPHHKKPAHQEPAFPVFLISVEIWKKNHFLFTKKETA